MGTYSCKLQCDTGYELSQDGSACLDVDECGSHSTLNPCHKSATCINKPGGYSCVCEDNSAVGDNQECICSYIF